MSSICASKWDVPVDFSAVRRRSIGSLVIRMMIAVMAAGCCHQSVAAVVTLDAVARGWYIDDGIANGNPAFEKDRNYLVGDAASTPGIPRQINRNFFVFDLSDVIGEITGASLNLFNPANGFSSQDAFENYAVFDVTTDITTLITHTTGQVEGVAIYNDLGSGTQYGAHIATTADDNAVVTVSLNAAALAALNQTSGLFAFGGAITTLDQVENNEYLFGFTGIGQRLGTQLVLEGELVPEPNTAYLGGLSFFLLGATVMIKRKQPTLADSRSGVMSKVDSSRRLPGNSPS